jgi:hypothetical protein
VEFWRSTGLDLLAATQRTDESLGLVPGVDGTVAVAGSSELPTPADNDKALAQLSAMMAGVIR